MTRYLVRRTIDESQIVEASTPSEAPEIAASRPQEWENGGEEDNIESEPLEGAA